MRLAAYRGHPLLERAGPTRGRAATMLTLLFALGCAVDASPETPSPKTERGPGQLQVRAVRQAVLGGVESDLDEVLFVRSLGGIYPANCSATLVAPNLVVTARHCVSQNTQGIYTCSLTGEVDDSAPRSPSTAGNVGLTFAGEDIEFYAGQTPDLTAPVALGVSVIAPETDTICRNDVAFVILDRELPVEPRSLRVGQGLIPGETIKVVGYGINETETNQRREKSGMVLMGAGPSEFYEEVGSAPPRTFMVGQGPCPGDSGGPALSEETGELIGVSSTYEPSDCANSNVLAVYTQVAAFGAIIEQAFAEAGYPELIEREPSEKPAGTGGEGFEGTGRAGESAAGDSSDGGQDSSGSAGCSLGHPARGGGHQAIGLGMLLFVWRRARTRCSGYGRHSPVARAPVRRT